MEDGVMSILEFFIIGEFYKMAAAIVFFQPSVELYVTAISKRKKRIVNFLTSIV